MTNLGDVFLVAGIEGPPPGVMTAGGGGFLPRDLVTDRANSLEGLTTRGGPGAT